MIQLDCLGNSCHAVITPTKFERLNYLDELSEAVAKSGTNHWIIASNLTPPMEAQFFTKPEFTTAVTDSLGAKLNAALSSLSECVEYVTWISDDDLISAGIIDAIRAAFMSDNNLAMAYGTCDFIDSNGQLLLRQVPVKFAHQFVAFGPNLIAQPTVTFRRSALVEVGGFSTGIFHGIDLDAYIRVLRVGKGRRLSLLVASWRAHGGSATVRNRLASAAGAFGSRSRNRNALQNVFCLPIEVILFLQSILLGVFFCLVRPR